MTDAAAAPAAEGPAILLDLPAEAGTGVARITLNRPERRNALSEALTPALRAALDAAESDPDVRVIVLTGAAAGRFRPGAVRA